VDGVVSVLLLGRARALGPAGEEWLSVLPSIVESLAHDWDLRLGRELGGGTAAYVVEANDDLVLKIELPEGDGFGARAAVLAAADGRGYARLYAHDEPRRAFLLERLLPAPVGYDEIARTLPAAWTVDVGVELPTGALKATQLAEFIERRADGLDVTRVLELCASRAAAYAPATAVVVHGDAQAANLLRRANGEHAFVDPEPCRCEPEYDLAVAQRHLPKAEGNDAVQEWHAIERTSTALELIRIGAVEEGRAWLS
jgi:streptomycin 6-kinase